MSDVSLSDPFKSEGDERSLYYSRQLLGTDILQGILAFLRASETHEPTNQIFDELLFRVYQPAQLWMDIFSIDALELYIKGEQFFLGEQRIRPKPHNLKKLKRLHHLFRDRGVTGLTLPKELERESLKQFLFYLAKTTPSNDGLQPHGLKGFEVNRLLWTPDGGVSASTSLGDMLFDQLFKVARDLFQGLQSNSAFSGTSNIEALLYELHHLSDEDYSGTFCRKILDPSDAPQATTAVLSAWLLHGWGKTLGLPPFVNVELSSCGLLHPVAAIEKVMGDRASTIMHHLHRMKDFFPTTHLQALALLEFTIGFGQRGVYTPGKHQAYQHVFSRMLRIAVYYAQMIAPDRRKAALTPSDAIQKLLSDDLGCDRSLARLFAGWIGLTPMGTFVKMATGEVGVVCSVGTELQSPERPHVMILKNREGQTLDKPEVLDLKEIREKLGTYKFSVKEELKSNVETGLAPEAIKNLLSQMNFSR